MNRRQVLAGLAGLTITGTSAWVATQELSTNSGLPVRIDTMNARGSTRGTTRVPVADTVTVIDLFATWCTPCKAQMDAIASVHDTYGDSIAIVSVTNERIGGTLSRANIRSWWRQNKGHWTLGLDPESELMATLGANGLPHIAIAASDGTITWQHSGVTDATTLGSEIEAALNR